MKKYILIPIAVFILSISASAQVYDNAAGLRASVGNYGVGPEFSYQLGLSDFNRVEVGLGIGLDNNFERFGITGAFHWAGDVQSGFSWFAGPAVAGWLYSINAGINKNQFINNGNSVGGGIGAQFGVQYDFDEDLSLPFTASFDTKPMYNFVSYYSGFEFAVGLSIRYTF